MSNFHSILGGALWALLSLTLVFAALEPVPAGAGGASGASGFGDMMSAGGQKLFVIGQHQAQEQGWA